MRCPAPSTAGRPLVIAAWAVVASAATAAIAGDPTVAVSFTEATVFTEVPVLDRPPKDADRRDGKRQSERTIAAVGLRAVSGKPAARHDAAACDIIVLVDTSASQVGTHRRRALEAVSAILAGKSPEKGDPSAKSAAADGSVERRFLLAAIDVDAEPLARGFSRGDSAENREAVQSLETRTPLGTTDLVEGLLAVVPLFEKTADGSGPAEDDRSPCRRIIYVGDGPGIGSVDAISFRGLLETLRSKRIGFSAVGLGERVNWPCLAAIANATGGMLAVPDDKASAADVGGQIADMTVAAIFWPGDVVLSSESHDAGLRFLPERLPPLRADRDTVVLVEGLLGKVRLEMSLAADGPQRAATTTEATVDVPEVAPKSDNAYLAELVRNASATGGIFLPTLGREGLELSRAAVRQEAAVLAGLGRQAEAAGASDAAVRLANASLRRDPDNAEAAVVRAAAARPEETKLAARLNADDDENPFDAPDDAGGRPVPGGGRSGPVEIEPLPGRVPPRRPAAAANQEPDELRQAEKMRRVRAGRLEQETAVRMRDARTKFPTDPDAAGTDLKNLLQEIASSDDLDPGLRDRLRRQVEMRIREADVRSREKQQRDLDAEQRRTAAREKLDLVNDLNRREQRFKALTERYDALVEEGIRVGYQRPTDSFMEAERVVADGPGGLSETAPNIFASPGMPMTARVIGRNAPLFARMLDYDAENMRIKRDMERGFMDTMNLVDVAAIPFSGEPPVIYPSSDRWREITRLREKYKSVDLANPSGNEQRINESLEKQVESLKFDETPLRDVIAAIEDKQGLQLELDTRALEDAGLDLETPITRNVSNISLRSALRLLLSDLDLTYIIKDEVLLITTKEKAGENLVVKVYPVADLVLPVNPSSGLNPFQTGGGLGGSGGLNSGMGGVMGAGGAGGMGGMGGGGMGGGMFQIADAREVAATGERAAPARPVEGLPQSVLGGEDLRLAVSDYLRQAGSPAETEKRLAQLRRSARDLGERESFAKAADLLCGAILAGHAEPWMYEALAAAAEAAGWERRQVERVLLSSADFATTPTDLLALAQYLGRSGSPARAISMCRRVVRLDPTNREAYALAMTLAAKSEDTRALEWSCVGVLSHDWPAGQEAIATRAARLAKMTIEKLSAAGRGDEAKAFKRAIDEALVRDLEITVTWGGDADVDIIVEDPTGAACSPAAPRTASGGVLISDAARTGSTAVSRNIDANEHRERYVCGEAFPGTYRMLVRRVWGEVEADTVSVEMVIRRGTSREERLRKQMPIGAGDLFLNVQVPDGRRREPLDDARVAQDIVAQQTIGKAVLAQQLAGMNDPTAADSLAQSRAAVSPQGTAGLPFFRQGAVGNQPVITTLPEGINLFARAVVSADRRYVRVTATPLFSSVGQVTTFQFSGGGGAAAGPAAGGPAAGGAGPAAGGAGAAAGGAAAGGAGAAAGGVAGGAGAGGAVGGGAGAGGAVGGGAGAGGAVGGGICWVAREVYGEANPRWMMFREWLTTRGPTWLLEIYRDHGEAFARWIHDKPAAKAAVRALMDRAIADLPSKAGERPAQGEPGPWPASE